MTKKLSLLALPLLLSGCDYIYNAADSLGSHMPTIGEPCRHWQCFTDEGQRQSNMNKKAEEPAKNTSTPKTQQPLKTQEKPQTQQPVPNTK